MARFPSNGEREALSRREHEVLRLLVRGFSQAEAARALRLSVADIDRTHANICRKLHLDGPDVYDYAVAIGLVSRNGR